VEKNGFRYVLIPLLSLVERLLGPLHQRLLTMRSSSTSSSKRRSQQLANDSSFFSFSDDNDMKQTDSSPDDTEYETDGTEHSDTEERGDQAWQLHRHAVQYGLPISHSFISLSISASYPSILLFMTPTQSGCLQL
jgi:hypothetical protein